MFVGGNRLAKRNISKILQGIRESVIPRITRFPKPVALREFLGGKRCESQQIVRTVLDHVDAQVVSRVDAEIRPASVAKNEPLELAQPVKRRMLDSLDFRNVHQPPERSEEHTSELQ